MADTPRDKIHELLTQVTPFEDDDDEREDGVELPEAGIVTGWVMVAAWRGSDGNKWISLLSGDATGEEPLATWEWKGLCHYAASNWED